MRRGLTPKLLQGPGFRQWSHIVFETAASQFRPDLVDLLGVTDFEWQSHAVPARRLRPGAVIRGGLIFGLLFLFALLLPEDAVASENAQDGSGPEDAMVLTQSADTPLAPTNGQTVVFEANGPALAAPSFSSPLPIVEWLLEEDEPTILTGYADEVEYEVALPMGWSATGGGWLVVEPVLTEIAREDAALTVELAQRPRATWVGGDSNLLLPIDVEEFAEPVDLRLTTTTPIAGDVDCIDPGHVARWIDVGVPVIRVPAEPSDLNLAQAVHGMGQMSALTSEPISVQLANPDHPAQLQAAGHVVSAISLHGEADGWNLVAGPDGSVPAGGAVLISTGDREATVRIEMAAGRPVILLDGRSEEVIAIAEAMSDPSRSLFFDRTELSFTQLPPAEVFEAGEVFTFSGAGYDDRTIRGHGEQRLIYRVHIPAGVPPDSASVALFATHAPSMAMEEAAFTVKINGSAEEILGIASADGELEVLHDVTPADLRPGLNFVTVEAQLGSQSSDRCGSQEVPGWFTVSNNSAVGVDRPENPVPVEVGVADARFALATQIDFSSTDVVISDTPSNEEIDVALNLISSLANRAQGGSPRLVHEASADRTRHLVVVGSNAERPLLSAVPYLSHSSSVGVVATVPSPYEEGRLFMAFASGTEEGLIRAIETGLSAEVNDIETPYALISDLATQPVGRVPVSAANPPTDAPEGLAFTDDGRVVGPTAELYEDWIISQADLVQAAREPDRSERRTVAFAVGLVVLSIVALWWLRQASSSGAQSH